MVTAEKTHADNEGAVYTSSRPEKTGKPLSIIELLRLVPDEAAAISFLEELRWPDGKVVCPHCKSKKAGPSSTLKRQSHRCHDCYKVFSVKTGTVMAKSQLPLQKWLLATYLILVSRTGIASTRIAEEIGCTQKTEWHLMHRIREGMRQEDGKWLSGIVEVDETFVGGKEGYKHKDKKIPKEVPYQGKLPVMGLRERHTGRVAAFPAPLMDNAYMRQKVIELVEPGSTIHTDGHSAYPTLWRYGFSHEFVNHNEGEYVRGDRHHQRHRELLVYLQTRLGRRVLRHKLGSPVRYPNEFAYRYNEPRRGLNFIEKTIGRMEGKSLPYKKLVILGRLRRERLIGRETLTLPPARDTRA